ELDVLEDERLDVARRLGAVAAVLPDGGVAEALVVAPRLAVDLVLDAEVAAAALLADERVLAHELGELEEVGDAVRLLERLVERVAPAEHGHLAPELRAQLGDPGERARERLPAARHAAVLPHEVAELLVERVHRALAAHGEQAIELGAHL